MITDAVVIGDRDYINIQTAEQNGEIMIMMEIADVLDLAADARQVLVEHALLHLADVLDHALAQQ